MDGQEYLNQLAAEARSTRKSAGGARFLQSKIFLVSAVGVIAFVLIAIVGAMLGSMKTSTKDLEIALMLHLENTSEVMQTYQTNVKSSDLRSISASLASVLANTDRKLTDFLTETYGFEEGDIEDDVTEKATTERDALEADLFDAKINGILDRTYAYKMSYEISLFMAEETKILNATSDENLREFLTTSYGSLNNLATKFEDFSETK